MGVKCATVCQMPEASVGGRSLEWNAPWGLRVGLCRPRACCLFRDGRGIRERETMCVIGPCRGR